MRLILGLLALYHVWRATRCSRAYLRHMNQRDRLLGRCRGGGKEPSMSVLCPPNTSTAPRSTRAARWLAETPDSAKEHPIMPYLRERFALSTKQAVDAIRAANERRAKAA